MRALAALAALALSGCGDCGRKPRPANPCPGDPTHSGRATYYAADGSGKCSFEPSPDDLMVAALDDVDYADAALCGACVAVTGPTGSVVVRVVDRCPGCEPGDVDLSREAFARIAPLEQGRVTVTWHVVACDVVAPIVYHFKERSNASWTGVQIRNHRYPVVTFERRRDDGVYEDVPRADFNYFVDCDGMGPGPYTFRLTDSKGHVVEDTGVALAAPTVPLSSATDVASASQFPPCD